MAWFTHEKIIEFPALRIWLALRAGFYQFPKKKPGRDDTARLH
jgi:hypothetical protein